MSRRGARWAWLAGGGAIVAVLAVLTVRNATVAVESPDPQRGARKAVIQQVLEASLPYRLAKRERRQMLSGTAALEDMARLHGNDLELTGGRVARYGEAPGITVWSGQAVGAAAAQAMVEAMARAIEAKATPFQQAAGPGDGTRRALGLGQAHAFYASGTQVVWVAAPASTLDEVLAELDAVLPRLAATTTATATTGTASGTQVRQRAIDYMAANRELVLTPAQQRVFQDALSGIPAPCCSDRTAYTCCCQCNLARTWWGLAKKAIVEDGSDTGVVRKAVEDWYATTNPDGFTGSSCYTGGCNRPFRENGCGGMDEERLVF